jgi:hypothetical protein
MFKNLPKEFTREMFVEQLNSQGFEGEFDFVYLPFDHVHNVSVGYAFANLKTNAIAKRCRECFEGFNDWSISSARECTTHWNEPDQGLQAQIERFRNSPVMHPAVPEEYRPVIFSKGVPVMFPAPTKKITKPRQRVTARTRAVLAAQD